jgi:hypothetical protein
MTLVWLSILLATFILAISLRQDWPFRTRPRRVAQGVVFDRRQTIHDSDRCFSAMIRWRGEDGVDREFTKANLAMESSPLGATVEFVYPLGRLELARVPSRRSRIVVYGVSLVLLAILVGRALGLLPASDGYGPVGL